MNIAWHDAAVQAAAISALGPIIAASIAAICAAIIGSRIDDRAKLKEQLAEATGDLAFLLAVENAHCEEHLKHTGKHKKLAMRSEIKKQGLTWTGKYTPGRARGRFDGTRQKPNISLKLLSLFNNH